MAHNLPTTFAEVMQSESVILGLQDYPYRLNYSIKKLQEAGFPTPRIHYGINGHKEDAREVGKTHGWRYVREEDGGSMAFSISMLQIWKHVVDEQIPYLTIFEDDVLPHPDIAMLGETYWRETPQDWDFLLLGNQFNCNTNKRVISIGAYCTHAYMITQQGAKKAFALIEQEGVAKLDCQIHAWADRNQIKCYCWNGQHLPLPYKLSTDPASLTDADTDYIWHSRATGLFYQNYTLRSVISNTARSKDG